jgi:hypothetical protein
MSFFMTFSLPLDAAQQRTRSPAARFLPLGTNCHFFRYGTRGFAAGILEETK